MTAPSFWQRVRNQVLLPLVGDSTRGVISALVRRRHNALGGPFNGQKRRAELVEALLMEFAPDVIVETGSFVGDTTAFFAKFGLTHTVELDPRYAAYVRTRFLFNRLVRVHTGDSRKVLEELTPSLREKKCFVYLDAHWDSEDLPLSDELKIISGWGSVMVIIDDFAVPGDPGYRFDSYKGGTLTLDYLPPLPDLKPYFPSVPSSEETGRKRGCVLLTAQPVISNMWKAAPE